MNATPNNTKSYAHFHIQTILTICITLLWNMSVNCDDDSLATISNEPVEVQVLDNKIDYQFYEISPIIDRCGAELQELDRCSAQLIAFGQSRVSYPNSMDEMDGVYCPNFKKNADCIKNSTECFKPFEKQIINWVLTSTRRMNYKRCKNDNEKHRFIRLTQSCFSSMKDPMNRCMSKYIASLEAIAEFGKFVGRQIDSNDLQIQLSCCANAKFKQCIMSNAKRQCKPVDIIKKLKRTNSNSSQRIAHRSAQKAMADMMEDLKKTMDSMALTGPEFICNKVDKQFCRLNFDGRFDGRTPLHRSIIPAMLKIYADN